MWVARGRAHLTACALNIHAEDAEWRQLQPLPCRHWGPGSPPGLQSPTFQLEQARLTSMLAPHALRAVSKCADLPPGD